MTPTTTSWSGQRRSYPTATRHRILQRHPTCQCPGCTACHTPCRRPSTIADHNPNHATLLRAGLDPDDEQYGQGMCGQCHNVKTAQERATGRTTTRRTPEQHPGIITP